MADPSPPPDSNQPSTSSLQALAQPDQASSGHSASAPPPEPRVPTPERFRGERRKFRAFKNACLLYLALQPRTFSSESVKVGFIISLLAEEPQTWAHNLLEQKSPVLNSTNSFFEAMAQLYEDPQRTVTAESALHALQQNKRPAEDYTVDFRRWAADTDWNEAALKYQYRHGLSEALKDELARVETPASLEDLIALAIQMDRRLRERRSECLQGSRATCVMPKVPFMASPLPGPAVNAPADGEPMQIGLIRSSLTPEERQRRRQANLCLYCGASGHFLRNCPVRPSKCCSRSVPNCQVSEPSPAHLILPVSLQVAEERIQLTAIIDSGACSCFLDCTLAAKLGVPLQAKEQQLQVFLADGSLPSSGPVTRETYPVLTTTDSGHQELLRFDVLSCLPPYFRSS